MHALALQTEKLYMLYSNKYDRLKKRFQIKFNYKNFKEHKNA